MLTNQVKWIILHHSGGIVSDPSFDTSSQTLETIDAYHKTLWPNFASKSGHHCGYHVVLEKNGLVRWAREPNEIGAHCVSMNDQSLGLCIIGNFDRLLSLPNSLPTPQQTESLKKLLKELSLKYNILPDHIVGHHFFAQKSCPGRNLSDSYGRDLIKDEIVPNIEEMERQKTLLQKILALLNQLVLLKIRLQNKLGSQKYA